MTQDSGKEGECCSFSHFTVDVRNTKKLVERMQVGLVRAEPLRQAGYSKGCSGFILLLAFFGVIVTLMLCPIMINAEVVQKTGGIVKSESAQITPEVSSYEIFPDVNFLNLCIFLTKHISKRARLFWTNRGDWADTISHRGLSNLSTINDTTGSSFHNEGLISGESIKRRGPPC